MTAKGWHEEVFWGVIELYPDCGGSSTNLYIS